MDTYANSQLRLKSKYITLHKYVNYKYVIRKLLFYCSIQLHTYGNDYAHAEIRMCANTYLSVFIFFIFTRTATITRKLRTNSLLSHLVIGQSFWIYSNGLQGQDYFITQRLVIVHKIGILMTEHIFICLT